VPLEVLDLALVLFGFFHRVEGAEVAAFAGGGVPLAGIEAVFAGFEFANHKKTDAVRETGEASETGDRSDQ
jgi:hypothetical protein